MRAIALLPFLVLAACGGGGGGGDEVVFTAPTQTFVRVIENSNSGTMAPLSDGSAVMVSVSGGPAMAFRNPETGDARDLGDTPVLSCLSPTGDLLWTRPLSTGEFRRLDLIPTRNGTFWLFGSTTETVRFGSLTVHDVTGGTTFFGVHFDRRGNVLRVHEFLTGEQISNPVFAMGDDGSFAMGATTRGSIAFNPGSADRQTLSTTADDVYVARFDASGRRLWHERVQSDGGVVRVRALCVRPDGDVVFHVTYEEGSTTILWVEEAPRLTGSGALVQLDAASLLVSLYESDSADWEAYAITPHLDGHVLTGEFVGTLPDVDNDVGDVTSTDLAGFVMRCDAEGEPEWTVLQEASPGASGRGQFYRVHAGATGRIVLTGTVEGNAVFGSKSGSIGGSSFGPRRNGVMMVLDAGGASERLDVIRAGVWSTASPAWILPGGDIVLKGETTDGFNVKGEPIDVTFDGDTLFFARFVAD